VKDCAAAQAVLKRPARATAAAAILLALSGVARVRVARGQAEVEGAHATGVLCLRKLPASIAFAAEGKGSSGFDYADTAEARARRAAGHPRLEVVVDGGAALIVDHDRGACVDGLALDVKHVVRASRPGVSRQWGRFSFTPAQTVLELRYDPFYGNIHVDPPAGRTATTVGVGSCAACASAAAATKKKKKRDVGSLAGRPLAADGRRERAGRWPKPATLTGPEPQMRELPQMEGVSILDHGQRRLHPDRWQIQAEVRDARAAAALRERGIEVKLGEYPTEQELKEDRPGSDAFAKSRRPRH